MSFLSFFCIYTAWKKVDAITVQSGWKSTEPFFLQGRGTRRNICLLLVHGFTGNPGDFRRLAAYMHERGFSVCAIRLPGHGTTPEDMNDTRFEDWWNHTLASYDLLAAAGFQERSIIPVGFSMGGLLAIKLSLVRPVGGLMTLATPIFLHDRRIRYAGIVKYFKKYIHKQPAISNYLVMERGAYSKTSLACVASLYKHIKRIKSVLPLVHAPIFVAHGLHDRTVRPESANYLYQKVSSRMKQIRFYPETSHAMMVDVRKDDVFGDMLAFAEQLETASLLGGCGKGKQEREAKVQPPSRQEESNAYAGQSVKPTLI